MTRFAVAMLAAFSLSQTLSPIPALAGDARVGAYDLLAGAVQTDLRYSEEIFDRHAHVTNKVARQLQARQSGVLETSRLYFGGRIIGTYIAEETNTAGKFPILSRLPPTHTGGKSDGYGVINEASLNLTLTMPWVIGFVQGEYTEVEYPGQDDLQLRKYWLAVGDLTQSPLYLAVGRKTVNFGQFETYAPFTHTHGAHYFWAQTDDPLLEIGYVSDRTELAFSLIPQHRGLRVISSPDNNGEYDNFALNASHRFGLPRGQSLRLGAGFLRGTIYDSTIAHHPPGVGINRKWNNAYNVNATYNAARFDLSAEYTWTEHAWPATGSEVSALTLQGRYKSQILGKPAAYTLSASRGEQGDNGTEWERMEQIILGLEVEPVPHVKLGAEYMYNAGFVPLILPRFTGDRSVESHTVIVGAKLTF